MSSIHKKILPQYFDLIASGKKKFELRLADFDVNEGDVLVLEEWDEERSDYTGRKLEVTANYILKTKDCDFWPPEDVEKYGFQIIGFESKENQLAQKPKIGVGVMTLKDGKVLLGRRKGSHGEGEYAFPGGHLEYMESFENCARREVLEECGIEIENIRFQLLSNVTKYAPKHYIHIGLIADWKSGEPQLLEPEKSESWGWYALDDLPEPIFEMCRQGLECLASKEMYLDAS